MTDPSHSAFSDPEAVAKYAEGPRRNVPGYDSLVPMTRILLAERMPPEGRVLVVGAGGGTFEVVEAYPDDKYLPSYLLLGQAGGDSFHVLMAADVEGDNIRVVTAYRPDAAAWQADMRTRRPRQ